MIEEIKKLTDNLVEDGCWHNDGEVIIEDCANLDCNECFARQIDKLIPQGDRPRIICLCGSTRFTNEMLIKQWWFTKYGFIVLSWCALPEDYFEGEDKTHIGDQEGVKEIVDAVHLRKIDLADEVFVINVGGYIGESTSNEIAYATKLGKPIKYLEEPDGK